MSIHIGNQTVKNITLGDNQVKRIWRGNDLVWEYQPDTGIVGWKFFRFNGTDWVNGINLVQIFVDGQNVLLNNATVTSNATGTPQGVINGVNALPGLNGTSNMWIQIELNEPISQASEFRVHHGWIGVGTNAQVSADGVAWFATTRRAGDTPLIFDVPIYN